MAARAGTTLHALAMELHAHGIIYAIHRRTGEIETHSVDEYRKLLSTGLMGGYLVRWSMRDALTAQSRIDMAPKRN